MTDLVSLLFVAMVPIDCKITNFSLYLLFMKSKNSCMITHRTHCCCSRGGGLMCGVCQGLDKVGWGQVLVFVMETFGCDSLNCCVIEIKWSQLNDITS